jgi:aldehyde:ferredoxin oxidoreductase
MAAKKKIAKKKSVKKVAKKKAVKKTAKKATKKSVKKTAKKVVKKTASKGGSKVTLGGNPVSTSGKLPKKGAAAPSFTLTTGTLQEISNKDFRGKRVILNIFPSIASVAPKVWQT